VLEAIFPGLKLPMMLTTDTLTRIRDGAGGAAFVRGSALRESQTVLFSKCCYPVPGDRIVGIVEDDGVHVHSIECENLEALEEMDGEKDRWIDLHWTLNAEKNTLSVARLRVNMQNKPGVLGQACTLIGEAKGNIVNISISNKPMDFLDVDFDIEVLDARHITNISAALRTSPMIESVDRVRG
jgi:GTP pyrophosphokinase/guanosine-3',5'-bis(diphosphate) 3'-pyrophosphohydrolase